MKTKMIVRGGKIYKYPPHTNIYQMHKKNGKVKQAALIQHRSVEGVPVFELTENEHYFYAPADNLEEAIEKFRAHLRNAMKTSLKEKLINFWDGVVFKIQSWFKK